MIPKIIYKTLRSIIFTLTLLVVGLYVLIYTLFSIPAFTNSVKDRICLELSNIIGGEVNIEGLNVYPFNEVRISGLSLTAPDGVRCLYVKTIGAGISLKKLIANGQIELTYGEIIGLDAYLAQDTPEGPLNIDFLIKALSSKDKNKEPKPFSLALKNVVLRKSSLSFYRPWMNDKKIGAFDLGNIRIKDLAADISFPKISDKEVDVDLRRLSLEIEDALSIEKIGFKGKIGKNGLEIRNFVIDFPQSRFYIPEISLVTPEGSTPVEVLKKDIHQVEITDSYLTPSDFKSLYAPLEEFTQPLQLSLIAKGNIEELTVENFYFGNPDVMRLSFSGRAVNLEDTKKISGDVSNLNLHVSPIVLASLGKNLNSIPPLARHALHLLNHIDLKCNLAADLADMAVSGNLTMESNLVSLKVEGSTEKSNGKVIRAEGETSIDHLHLQQLFPAVPLTDINSNITADVAVKDGMIEGEASLIVKNFEFKGKRYDGLSLNINKVEDFFDGDLWIHNEIADLETKFAGNIESLEKNLRLDMDLMRLNLSEIADLKKFNDYMIGATINIDAVGRDKENFDIGANINNLTFEAPDNSKRLRLKELDISAQGSDSTQSFNIKSDWIDLRADGNYRLEKLPHQLSAMAETIFPALFEQEVTHFHEFASDLDFDIIIKKNNALTEFFNLPVRLLVPVTITGEIKGHENTANLTLDLPYLQQGRDKLIYDTKLIADINGNDGVLNALIETNVPVKRGDLSLNVNIFGHRNTLSTDIHWINTENSDFKGHLSLDTEFSKNPFNRQPEIDLLIKPSVLKMGTADWNLAKSSVSYRDNTVTVDKLRLWHEDQMVQVDGIASPEYSDALTVSLADIDVDYVFDMLQINYVTFGGVATGDITGRALLSGNPVAETDSLLIRDFTYNGSLLGDCMATSRWNNEEKEIEIGADIRNNGLQKVLASGGIWLGKDSLSFKIDANKVPVDFVQPFMAVFSSHVGGFATGDINLFGTFHDIDMTGKIFADSVAVKLDYTNTIYHGSDSVILTPGRIDIPHFTLYDKFGNSALLTGELTHHYFHEPSFTFRLSDANNFLCYDTTSELNPDWYGTLFGTGSAYLTGVPGLTDISADMTVSGNSNFTFVLNDTEYARDYQFLTFSDKKAEAARLLNQTLTTKDIKEMLRQSMQQEEPGLSRFGIDIRATVTPQVLFTLVMDPASGDKITARGRGALQVKYESDNDEMMMYGKYEIAEGNYNFSLQDIILRDFKIKEGSYITFNGNPLTADLDISATYRVNTNLSDLDKSFSTDRDLNRTNVPVDAVLSVMGNMTSPDITFDIELPTLTQDVERKVKSIISTDDMMNRQIIYLLALNRFYTPEYMGATGNGGELAAVASTTISSQLSNILGQLTDKFSVSPSFRSDKGDFSDIEVDVALSSRLLNNRLLINGNFGYRDKSNSSTTFVGDFDVEYLLSKNGNLRLKAYNHFNDQNYYLREALTTQGLGIVYRKDFNDMFKFLKKKRQNGDKD